MPESRGAVSMEIPIGIPVGMGMGTVMNPHEPVGILWGFLKDVILSRSACAINVIVDV